MSKLQWYGYMHINGQIFVKRYLGDMGDIDEARESNFTKFVHGPFEAVNREDAMIELVKKFNQAGASVGKIPPQSNAQDAAVGQDQKES